MEAEDLRRALIGHPYSNMAAWMYDLKSFGDNYLANLSEYQLLKLKDILDERLLGIPAKRSSFYDDDPVKIGLDNQE